MVAVESVVENAIKGSLGLDDDVVVDLNVPISSLTENFDVLDMSDILFRCEVFHQEHYSGGEISEKGRAYLRNLRLGFVDELYRIRLDRLSRAPTREIVKSLIPSDIHIMRSNEEHE